MRTQLAACAAIASMIAALSTADAAPGKRVALFINGPTNTWVAALAASFRDRGRQLGLDVTEFDTNYDPSLQSQQVDDAVARKFDVLAVMPASDLAILPALTRAKAAKLPVVLFNTAIKGGSESPLFVTFVGSDHYVLGKNAGVSLLKALKDSGRETAKVALITGNLTQDNTRSRIAGFTDAVKAEKGVTIVATEDAQWDTVKSEQMAAQLLARFAPHGGLDAIYAMADNQAVAVIKAADSAGVPLGSAKGDLLVVSSNCDRNGLQAIQDGKLRSTGTAVPGPMGVAAAEATAAVLEGKSQPKVQMLKDSTVDKSDLGQFSAVCTY